jgi:hypothetical protein
MAFTIGPQYTQRTYTWTAWKALYAVRGSLLQYDDDGTVYSIWAYDGPEVLMCQIYKGEVPYTATAIYSQSQNDSDKADFEANYKAFGNQSLYQSDTDGAQIVRQKAAKKGWSFWACPIEVTTSALGGSVYCKYADGTDVPGITCKIYNSIEAEITTAGLANINLATCVKTVLDFEPAFDYEIIGGELRINSNPAQDIRMWIVGAPDIPAIYGGSKEFASGVNLKFMASDGSFDVDGRVTKFISYNPTTHQGKLRILLKHPAGAAVNMQFVIHMYRQ